MKLFEQGALCSLNISRWSGTIQLSRQDMKALGINPDALPKELTTNGKKSLISPIELSSITRIESKARSYLSYKSTHFILPGCVFVPKGFFKEVEDKLSDLAKEYSKAVDEFILKFDTLKNNVKEKYPEFWGKTLKNFYPENPQILRSKFDFRFHFFKIDSLDAQKHEQMQKEVQEFVGEYVGAMRHRTIEFCNLMEARLLGRPFGDEEETKQLTGKSLSSFRKYIDDFSKLNIFGDSEIETLLTSFRKDHMNEFNTVETFDNNLVKSAVVKALDVIRNKASNLDEGSKFIDSLKRKIEL